MKRLMKVFSDGTPMWKERRMTGLLRGCTGSRSVGRPWKRWIDTVKDCLKEEMFGCQACKENSA